MSEIRLSSDNKVVTIGTQQPTVLIGERINPAGKKRMQEAFKTGNLELVRQEALSQVKDGADVIDVNVTMPDTDEMELLPRVVKLVQETVDVPLCIDSPNPQALEVALKLCKGKPLVNSVTGEQKSLDNVLPLVKEHRAAVIGIPQDESGVPREASRRLEIAGKIIEQAEAIGIKRDDIIIDCLALAICTDFESGLAAIETANQIKTMLGVNTVIAVSNLSFGLPDRVTPNGAFAAMVIASGINCLIADVGKLRPVVLAADLILGRDQYARRYISAYREQQAEQRSVD